MASPRAKNSKSARRMTSAMPRATKAVEPKNTSATTAGINTTAVATRFQVIEMDSPDESRVLSHHISRKKSRMRVKQGWRPGRRAYTYEEVSEFASAIESR